MTSDSALALDSIRRNLYFTAIRIREPPTLGGLMTGVGGPGPGYVGQKFDPASLLAATEGGPLE